MAFLQSKHVIYSILLLGVLVHKYYCKEQTYVYKAAEELRFQVVEFKFDHVSDVYAITLWILLGSLAKVGLCIVDIQQKLVNDFFFFL